MDLIRKQVAEASERVETATGSPEVVSYELAQELRVAATMMTTELLRRGISQMPESIVASEVSIRNERLP